MQNLAGKVAWVTGAGSGIGEAAALALAGAGTTVVLTGRRKEPLESVAARIKQAGGTAHVQPGDMTRAASAQAVADFIESELKRLDILVNNAGTNIADRSWEKLSPSGVDTLIHGNLSSSFYCVIAALPIMRRQKDGVIIKYFVERGSVHHRPARFRLCGGKHGVVTLSYGINMEEGKNGIRATALCPHEVATPILDRRPVPVSPKVRAPGMFKSEDVGDLILISRPFRRACASVKC